MVLPRKVCLLWSEWMLFTVNNNDQAPERYIDALAKTYDDIIAQIRNGQAIVSMSWGVDVRKDQTYDDCVRDTFADLVQSLLDIDVPPLCSTGQDFYMPPVPSTWPQMLTNGKITNFFVVGGINIDGSFYESLDAP